MTQPASENGKARLRMLWLLVALLFSVCIEVDLSVPRVYLIECEAASSKTKKVLKSIAKRPAKMARKKKAAMF